VSANKVNLLSSCEKVVDWKNLFSADICIIPNGKEPAYARLLRI
jgi:hypothetical protein